MVCVRAIALLALLSFTATHSSAQTRAFTIVDDPELNRAVGEVRAAYLAVAPHDRLDVCLLVRDEAEDVWRRGAWGGEEVAYPASCVKLPFMAAAMVWCRENGLPYDHLDEFVRPMIVESDNVATGHVVDIITSAPNFDEPIGGSPAYEAWLEARRYVERFLDERGLLGNQILVHKTFPSNSGPSPVGAEAMARETEGMNAMQPNLSAELMLEIIHAAIENEANAYMRSLLRREPREGGAYIGHGCPPGSVVESKPGMAYDTREDIARVVLPNGREFILAIFSDGRERGQVASPRVSRFGTFVDALIDRTGLRDGCPPRVQVTAEDADRFHLAGHWSAGRLRRDKRAPIYHYHAGGTGRGTATWDLRVPETGFYEVSAWYPEGPLHAVSAEFIVSHAGGEESVVIDQRVGGGRWVPLGDFTIEAGSGHVTLSAAAASFERMVVADAVQATLWPPMSPEPGTDVVVDNDHVAPHFVLTGDDWGSSPWRGHDGRTYGYAHCGTDAAATWIAPLTAAGLYEVSTHFRAGPNRATRAVFVVETTDGPQTVEIDQTGEDMVWRTLGTFAFEAGDAAVTLRAADSTGGDVVIADAVRFARLREP